MFESLTRFRTFFNKGEGLCRAHSGDALSLLSEVAKKHGIQKSETVRQNHTAVVELGEEATVNFQLPTRVEEGGDDENPVVASSSNVVVCDSVLSVVALSQELVGGGVDNDNSGVTLHSGTAEDGLCDNSDTVQVDDVRDHLPVPMCITDAAAGGSAEVAERQTAVLCEPLRPRSGIRRYLHRVRHGCRVTWRRATALMLSGVTTHFLMPVWTQINATLILFWIKICTSAMVKVMVAGWVKVGAGLLVLATIPLLLTPFLMLFELVFTLTMLTGLWYLVVNVVV